MPVRVVLRNTQYAIRNTQYSSTKPKDQFHDARRVGARFESIKCGENNAVAILQGVSILLDRLAIDKGAIHGWAASG